MTVGAFFFSKLPNLVLEWIFMNCDDKVCIFLFCYTHVVLNDVFATAKEQI